MGCVYKNWVQYASKGEIELAVFKAFLKLLLGVWVFGLRLAVLLFFGLSFSLTRIYDTHTINPPIKKRNKGVEVIFLRDFILAWTEYC